jgi:hypothetical protein
MYIATCALVALAAARVLHPPAEVIERVSKAWPSLVNMQTMYNVHSPSSRACELRCMAVSCTAGRQRRDLMRSPFIAT